MPLGKHTYRFIARRRYRMNRMLGVELPDCADRQLQDAALTRFSAFGADPVAARQHGAIIVDPILQDAAVGFDDFG